MQLPSPTPILNAVTATTTSAGISVENYRDLVVEFLASGISAGNGVFTIDGSNDGTNWVAGIAFLDVTATATGTSVTSKTLNSNTTGAGYVRSGWKMIRVKVTVTTDGVYSASICGNKIALR